MKCSAMFLWVPVIALAVTLPAAAVEPTHRLQRASGLWKVTPATSPFSWEICVDQSKDRLIDDDLWAGFEQECKIESESGKGDGYTFTSTCPDAKMSGSFRGDLAKSYVLTADTSFDLNGKLETQHYVVNGVFQGACPADMEPGVKKMRGGMKLNSLYLNR
ncbi:DUF3617 domain-containing protein [Pseudomonas cremoricolorata]|uniref:DUF3617 family protein n=1 Tax=Pseudomonas cremoricolorata TaxID=157783 RepID=A0A089WVK5_9PSED|nr:hypothetical protein [Pseudomonas cremoricolorata]AIR90607.1 hypothetical protein LK03_15565 [Pseudomonas cremoricolorata]